MLRSTFGGFNAALSALQANQLRLDITGQNLANMNTVGYTRQQLNVSSLHSSGAVSHFSSNPMTSVGCGVAMTGVSQIRDPFLDMQYRLQMTKAGYSDSFQTSLDSLSHIFDETNVSGMQDAFRDILSSLQNLQDPSKVKDPIYEAEFRSRMQKLANLLNDSAQQISQAAKDEYARLDGSGTSESGMVDSVNDILMQIGQLNRQIKSSELAGQSALELKDERNRLLDELSSYIPIETTYYKDQAHDGIADDGSEAPEEIYDMDLDGNVIGKKQWPDDLRVSLVYKDADGNTQRLTLVEGTSGKGSDNYGKLTVSGASPEEAQVTFQKAAGATGSGQPASVSAGAARDAVSLSGGNIAASLNMLTADSAGSPVKGYQYYAAQLDLLAKTFADTMNRLNNNGEDGGANHLFENRLGDGGEITAANISVSQGWISGEIHISTSGEQSNSAVLEMIKAMENPQDALGGNTFVGFVDHVSTTLANDSYNNTSSLKTNVTVLNGIQNSRDSISGVSLDEEAASMMSYISAYNAASRLMTTLDEALNTLINGTGLVGR